MTKEEAVAKLTEALTKLEALGSPRAIADFLIAGGFKSIPWQDGKIRQSITYRCPVGRYLQAETGIESAWAGVLSCGCDLPRTEVDTPSTVRAFILAFDQQHYPELDYTMEDTINA